MKDTAERTAALEQEVRTRQQAENVASLTAAVGLALTRGTELPAMLQQCAEALVQRLDGGLARIWTADDRGDALELQAERRRLRRSSMRSTRASASARSPSARWRRRASRS